jgi:dihydrodipicolinate synthase/N-acetylneuraminate lyase
VHTTQFAIREAGLYESVLRIGAETVDATAAATGKTLIKVGGVIGGTDQAVGEAKIAADLGYDLVLVGLGGTTGWSDDDLVNHVRKVSEILPAFGFYLQPSVGGRPLPYSFWRKLAELEGVHAIKIAPFNRYQTIDVVRAVAESSRRNEIALYTGNDDNIVADLLTAFRFDVDGSPVEKRIVGGLLGHWAAWNKSAVDILEQCRAAIASPAANDALELLALGTSVTDSNDAFFDSRNAFVGSIAGIHEVLRRQGLLEGRWCLDPNEDLSPGQMEEIDRVYAAYPHLNDDAFVAAHLDEWLEA